jgi:hypothetical protein
MARKRAPLTVSVHDVIYTSGPSTIYAGTFTNVTDATAFATTYKQAHPTETVVSLARTVTLTAGQTFVVDFCP